MPSTTKNTTESTKAVKKPVKKPTVKATTATAKPKKVAKKVEEVKAAKPVRKAATKTATKSMTNVTEAIITSEDRHRMIAEAAYYLAEKRGFRGGCAENDWYLAAQQIDKMIINR